MLWVIKLNNKKWFTQSIPNNWDCYSHEYKNESAWLMNWILTVVNEFYFLCSKEEDSKKSSSSRWWRKCFWRRKDAHQLRRGFPGLQMNPRYHQTIIIIFCILSSLIFNKILPFWKPNSFTVLRHRTNRGNRKCNLMAISLDLKIITNVHCFFIS